MLQRALLFTLFILLTACGPARIEKPNNDLPTLIEVVRLDVGSQQLIIRLSHRQAQVRDASTLQCQLQIDQSKAITLPVLQTPELTSYAREVLAWSIPDSLSIPTQARIDYDFDCSLRSAKWRDEHFYSRGTLYRLGHQEPPIYR